MGLGGAVGLGSDGEALNVKAGLGAGAEAGVKVKGAWLGGAAAGGGGLHVSAPDAPHAPAAPAPGIAPVAAAPAPGAAAPAAAPAPAAAAAPPAPPRMLREENSCQMRSTVACTWALSGAGAVGAGGGEASAGVAPGEAAGAEAAEGEGEGRPAKGVGEGAPAKMLKLLPPVAAGPPAGCWPA